MKMLIFLPCLVNILWPPPTRAGISLGGTMSTAEELAARQRFHGVEEVVENLFQLDNTDIHYITDFATDFRSGLPARLAAKQVPSFVYNVHDLADTMYSGPKEKCPIFIINSHGAEGGDHGDGHGDDHGDGHGDDHNDDHGDDHANGQADDHADGHAEYDHAGNVIEDWDWVKYNLTSVAMEFPDNFAKPSLERVGQYKDTYIFPATQIFVRPQILHMGIYRKTVVIWVTDVGKVLNLFRDTAMYCQQEVDVGVYKPEDRFVFVVDNDRDRDTVLLDPYVRKHSQVAVMRSLQDSPGHYLFFSYNFFHQQGEDLSQRIVMNFLWKPENKFTRREQVFTSLKHFNGHKFKIGVLPWAHHVLADLVEAPEGTPATYKNYWGYEIDLLKSSAKILNFDYEFSNVEDGKWGHVEADGKWSGMILQAAYGDVDFVICDVFIIYHRVQMLDGSMAFDKDFQGFVAPNPKAVPKSLAIIKPMTPLVWLTIVMSALVSSLAFFSISRAEEKAVGFLHLTNWEKLSSATFYCLSTLCNQSTVISDYMTAGANAIRLFMAIWLLHCLILTTAYSGNLTSFLTTPDYSSPIGTLKDVLDSGLPWGMVLYGEEEEELMAESTDPVIKKIWTDKIVMPYKPNLNLDNVLDGKEIFIDWKSGLEPALFSKYSTPGGKPLIHMSSNAVFMPNYPGWGFHKFNPWRNRFDEIISRHLEAGMIDEWKWRTWVRMKQEKVAAGDVLDYEEPEANAPLLLDDLQSAFYFLFIFTGLALMILCVEGIVSQHRAKSRTTSREVTPRKTAQW